jgi:hypothetical protein
MISCFAQKVKSNDGRSSKIGIAEKKVPMRRMYCGSNMAIMKRTGEESLRKIICSFLTPTGEFIESVKAIRLVLPKDVGIM